MPPTQSAGDFTEHDLDDDGRLVPVDRPLATNPAGIVVGVVRNYTERYPEGMERVTLLGDPTKSLGSLAEPECRRIIAALDLAEERGVPLEWFALSAGAKIAMDSGTENMDWIAAVLRRIIEFTQRGGELNVVVAGINVGAQPYWNAEATMLMHTRGHPRDDAGERDGADRQAGARLLGRRLGGGQLRDRRLRADHGPERPGPVLGPGSRRRLPRAARLLRARLRGARRAVPAPRNDVGSARSRRRRDAAPLRLAARSSRRHLLRRDESRPQGGLRHPLGDASDDRPGSPARWSAGRPCGTPRAPSSGTPISAAGRWRCSGSSRVRSLRRGSGARGRPDAVDVRHAVPTLLEEDRRAINAVAGRRPVVVLANLAGFDGSPESMREWQLEFGAEIGRAVVNFDGPIVFCVISRYHGGAFVVFSQRLNENLETVALEGAHASVIGGAPAAAVVFAREVKQSTDRDPRITALDERIAAAEGPERTRLRAERSELWDQVHAEKQGELAAEFDSVHSVERAVEMGSVSSIIPPAELRPYLIEAIERGMQRISGEGDER